MTLVAKQYGSLIARDDLALSVEAGEILGGRLAPIAKPPKAVRKLFAGQDR